MKLNYEIIASGSKGNCVVIENIMIDCGVSFNRIKEQLYNVDYLLLTHIHSDHINVSTLKKIKKLFPNILMIGNYEVANYVDIDIIANSGYHVKNVPIDFLPFECVHDVLTYGYMWTMKKKRIIYATDTNNLNNVPNDEKFDYFFIESNYDEDKIKLAQAKKGYDPKMSAIRHLSTQKAKAFYYLRRKNKQSKLIELHKSERFY
ncbi:MBL fold metallo-hydrolase [Carnobacteriaceae bacterium zg-ZUI78]|nr:MBL fold metallo-hydrolase [Carnobacteriaceae bacterium zg-ZUI78]